MNIIKYEWTPHPAQRKIFSSDHKYKTIVCGRRFGKTEMALNWLFRCATEDPGEYRYLGPTYKQTKRIAWRKLKKIIPWQVIPKNGKNEQELYIEVANPVLKAISRIQLLGMEDPDAVKGEGWKGAVVDEYDSMYKTAVDEAVIPALTDYDGWLWKMGTPKGRYNLWEDFIRDPEYTDPTYRTIDDEPIEPDPEYKSFHFTSYDNPYLKREVIERAKRRMTVDAAEQEFMASFNSYSGLVYKEFMKYKDELVIKPIKLEPWWHYYIGVDTGRYTAVLLKCIDHNGNEYTIDEIFNYDGLVKDISAHIKQKTSGLKIRAQVIDSASQAKREYESHGLYFTDSKKDTQASIQMTRRKMQAKQWFVFDTCHNFIRELGARRWDENKRKSEPVKENDHCCNAEDYIQTTFLTTPHVPRTEFQKRRDKEMQEVFKGHVNKAEDWRIA